MHRAFAGAAVALALVLPGTLCAAVERPRHPVPATPLRALPSLESSDEVVRAAVLKVGGAQDFAPMLSAAGVIRRFVARVDDVASGGDACPAALAALARIDTRGAVMVYSRLYPLLQQAYEEHSRERGYFNDRLVDAIDRLLDQDARYAPSLREKLQEMRALVALRAPGR